MPKERPTALLKVATGALAVGALWVAVFGVLYLLVQPLTLRDGQMVFDPVALLEAASIMVFLAAIPWTPAFLFLRKRPGLLSFGFIALLAWGVMSALFGRLDGTVSMLSIGRAAEVAADGQDIVFMPVVIPAVSLLSGATYCLALGLFRRLTERDLAEPEGATA